MNLNLSYRPILLMLITFHAFQCFATSNQSPFIDSIEWKNASKNLDFDEKIKPIEKEKKKEKTQNKRDFNFGISKNVLIITVIILVAGILILILYSFKGRNIQLINTKTKFNINNLNELSDEEEILKAIENAINTQNLNLAFRYKYLQVIQQLISRNIIHFKKYNTNFDLVYQIKSSKTQDVFKFLTVVFDAIYYGEKEINEEEYKSFVLDFEELKTLIGSYES